MMSGENISGNASSLTARRDLAGPCAVSSWAKTAADHIVVLPQVPSNSTTDAPAKRRYRASLICAQLGM